MQKALLVVGIVIIVIALVWPLLAKLPFGKLPGDISFSRPGFQFFMPITTMIIVSIVLSLVLWFFRR